RVGRHQAAERLRPAPDHTEALAEILAPIGGRRLAPHQIRQALGDRLDRGERVVQLVAEHADEALPRLPLLLAPRAAHVGDDEELMRQPALAKRATPQLPAPQPRPPRERDFEDSGRVARQTVGEPEPGPVLAQALPCPPAEQPRPTP